MSDSPFVLVDGSSYLFRAYHALPSLTTDDGMPTGAIYGVINMLRRLISDYNPEHIAVVFDTKGKNFRHDMYADYKANRPEMPEELRVQIEPLHDIIKAMGLPLLAVPGVEADDVIGTLAKQASAAGYDVLISTGDKDFAQLVDDKITLVNTMTNQVLDAQGVVDKFGVVPAQIIDYLALMGDTVDNVPGVPKVGPKTAVKWLAEYLSLDNIIEQSDNIKGKVGENLRTHLDWLPMAKALVTIKTTVELNAGIEALVFQTANKDVLEKWFKQLSFNSWLKALNPVQEVISKPANYTIVTEKSEFDAWCDRLEKSSYFALDTETTSLNPMLAKLVGISFSCEPGEAAYVPLTHYYMGVPEQLDRNYVLNRIGALLGNPALSVVAQNLKYDYKVLSRLGIQWQANLLDTMLMSYVLYGTSTRHNMDAMALKHLAYETTTYSSIAGKGKSQKTFDEIDLSLAGPYAAEDADITLQLAEVFQPLLDEHVAAKKILTEIELPLLPVLAKMEMHGILLDVASLKKQSAVAAADIAKLEKEIYALAGETFNIASTKQLGHIFYEKLKLPILKKTPKGQPSTNEAVLHQLAVDYPLPALILTYRSLAKLKSTYLDALPEQVNPMTHRVHTSFRQAVTATGRLSSTDPNLQNIPVRTQAGRDIRCAFIAREGCVLASLDYSQVELRIMAHLSQDKTLLQAFEKQLDVHQATAAEIFSVPLTDVTTEQRRRAKAVNFGLIYGMSAYGLSQQLDIARDEAQHYIDVYFERYPGVLRYMEDTRERASANGFVETIAGRRLMLPDINSKNGLMRKAAERAAINAPMQGSAADIIKVAMIKIDAWLSNTHPDVLMILQVHDELIFEIPKPLVDDVVPMLKQMMEEAVALSVPLTVDAGVGASWDEAH